MNIKTLTKQLVGLSLEDAKTIYKDYRIRVRTNDGSPLMGTCDFLPTRINVSVEKGIITKVEGLG
jgi:hypothetical protein